MTMNINTQSSGDKIEQHSLKNKYKFSDWPGSEFSVIVRPTTLMAPGNPFSGKQPTHTLGTKVHNTEY